MKNAVDEERRGKSEGSATNETSGELRRHAQRNDVTELGRIDVQSIGDELDQRTTKPEIEQRQILGNRPRDREQAETGSAQASRYDRNDEKRQRQRHGESDEIQQRVVGDARAIHG